MENFRGPNKSSISVPSTPLTLSPLFSSPPGSSFHQVVTDYVPEHDGEIGLVVGDVIASIKDLGNSWTLGKNLSDSNVIGVFPSTCIRLIQCSDDSGDLTPACARPVGVRHDSVDLLVDRCENEANDLEIVHKDKVRCPQQRVNADKSNNKGQSNTQEQVTSRCYRRRDITRDCCEGFDVNDKGERDIEDPIISQRSYEQDARSFALPPSSCAGIIQGHTHLKADGLQRDLRQDDTSPEQQNELVDEWSVRKPRMIVKPNLDKGFCSTVYDAYDEHARDTQARDAVASDERSAVQPDLANDQNAGVLYDVNSVEYRLGSIVAVPRCRTTVPPCDLRLKPSSANGTMPVPHPKTQGESNTSNDDAPCSCEIFRGNSRTGETDHQPQCQSRDNDLTMEHRCWPGKRLVLENPDEAGQMPRFYCVHSDFCNSSSGEQPHVDLSGVTSASRAEFYESEMSYASERKPRLRAGSASGKNVDKRADDSTEDDTQDATDAKFCRVLVSTLTGLLTGFVLFLWMYCQLGYSSAIAVIVSGTAAIVMSLFLTLSRVCRCAAAILLPSIVTTRGRIAFIVILSGFLLGGPINNVYLNMAEVSRSMSCSAEQSYNQTNFLLRPFDSMMRQLNVTILRLEEAAHNVSRGLRPLDDGLANVELDLHNGKLQLLGTRKTCKNLMDRAYNACLAGIHKAQDQCLSVMGALGTVYHHARVVLDRINPDRWSKQQNAAAAAAAAVGGGGGGGSGASGSTSGVSLKPGSPLSSSGTGAGVIAGIGGSSGTGLAAGQGGTAGEALLHKRQVIVDQTRVLEEIELSASDRDICEPLDTFLVCHSLNDSESLCQPSRWAGEAIQDAINSTQAAMSRLQGALQFYVSSEPYSTSRLNASTVTFDIRRRVQEDFASKAAYLQLMISVLQKLVPLALLFIIYSTYVHLKLYMTRDTYDNIYVTERLRELDEEMRGFCGGENRSSCGSVLPLKQYERRYLVDATRSSLSVPETGWYRIGLCVFFLHFLLAVTCYTFDYVLYWVLALVQRHGRPGFDATGGESLDLVLNGEGIIVELLEVFLKGFHTNHGFSFVGDTQACLPAPQRPQIGKLVVLIALYIVLLLTILFKAHILRLRNAITGYFYSQREKSRLAYLRNVIREQRARLPHVLHHVVRANFNCTMTAHQSTGAFPLRNTAATSGNDVKDGSRRWQGGCCSCSQGTEHQAACLVCGCLENESFRACESSGCHGIYCGDCFTDLRRVCPLCFQHAATVSSTSVTMTTACNENFEYDDDVTTNGVTTLGHEHYCQSRQDKNEVGEQCNNYYASANCTMLL